MPAHRFRPRRAVRIAATAAVIVGIAALPAAPAMSLDTAPETQVAVIVPLVAPARAFGLIPADELAAMTAANGSLGRALAVAGDLPVTLAVDPLIAASVEALGDDAPPSAVAWLERLGSAKAEVDSLPPADADPALLLATGLAVPSTTELVWTPPGETTSAVVAGAGDAALLIPDSDLASRADPSTARIVIDDRPAIVIDTSASDALADAMRGGSAAVLTAALQSRGGTSVVIGLPRDGQAFSGLRELLAALGTSPGLELVPLRALSEAAGDAVLIDGTTDGDRVDRMRQVVEEGSADSAFATITADPAAVVEDRVLRDYALASTAWIADATWSDAVGAAIDDSKLYRASVRIEEVDSLFLADRSSIPVAIVNDLDEPVTVVVTVRTADGRLDVDPAPVTVEVPAAARTTVEFSASAVSNGTVAVTARLASVTGVPIGQPAVAKVNVQAGWETPIVAAAAGLLGIIIILGIIRTVRRVRRTRAAADG